MDYQRLRTPYRNVPNTSCVTAPEAGSATPSGKKLRWQSVASLIAGALLLLVAMAVVAPTPSSAIDIGISIRIGPPPLPVYAQPLCPGPGYIWTPGYWAYDPNNGYYWVPGTWVLAPVPGLLWTPGYWGWSGGVFIWHAGYWGPHVGFYGGINYGFGYTGVGYAGGYWRGGAFFYNRAVNNINVTNITNMYNKTVVNNVNVSHVAFNGGPGGLTARPTPAEMAAEHDRHIVATSIQQQHQNLARQNRAQFASVNHGRPSVPASARPGEFRGGGTARPAGGQRVAPHGTPYTPPNNARFERTSPAGGTTHPSKPAAPPANRSFERPQGKTPSVQPRQEHAQPTHAAPSGKPKGSPHPQAHQEERKANPPAEKKPEGREPEHH